MPPAWAQRDSIKYNRNKAGREMMVMHLQAYPVPGAHVAQYEARIYAPGRLRYAAVTAKGKTQPVRHFEIMSSFIKNLAVALQKAKFLAMPDSLPMLATEQKMRLSAISLGKRKTIVFPRQTQKPELRKLLDEFEANLQTIVQEQEPMVDTVGY